MPTRYSLRWLQFASIALVVVLVATAAGLARADAPLVVRFAAEGRYAIVSGGVGLETVGAGDIVLNVPGTRVVAAYLYWAGFDTATSGGDDTIRFAVDGAAGVERIADIPWGPDFWYDDWYRYLYVEDVTDQVLIGNHTYRISEFGPLEQMDGAGLVVVYEDPTLPVQRIELRDGQDNFFEGWAPPRGPNSEIACFEFTPQPFNRPTNYYVIVGGVAAEGESRPVALWARTGTGAPPTTIINQPGAVEVDGPPEPYPFFNSDGREWDTYRNTLTVPANDTYVCLQIESVADEGTLLGASGVWLAVGGSFQVDEFPPTPVPPTAIPPTSVPPTEPPSSGGSNTSGGTTTTTTTGSCGGVMTMNGSSTDPLAGPGSQVTWTIVTNNPCPTPLTDVVVETQVDSTLYGPIVGATTSRGTAVVNGANIRFNLGTLNQNDTVTMTVITRLRNVIPASEVCPFAALMSGFGLIGGVQQGNASIRCVPFPSRLPQTGYPPVQPDATGWLSLGGGLLVLGAVGLTRRKTR